MNIQKMMKQAQQMQQKMEDAQASLGELEVEGTAGNGLVKTTLTGKNDVIAISIDPKIVDPDDIEMLEDLLIAAFNDGHKKVEAESARVMGQVSSGISLPPGMKLPF